MQLSCHRQWAIENKEWIRKYLGSRVNQFNSFEWSFWCYYFAIILETQLSTNEVTWNPHELNSLSLQQEWTTDASVYAIPDSINSTASTVSSSPNHPPIIDQQRSRMENEAPTSVLWQFPHSNVNKWLESSNYQYKFQRHTRITSHYCWMEHFYSIFNKPCSITRVFCFGICLR